MRKLNDMKDKNNFSPFERSFSILIDSFFEGLSNRVAKDFSSKLMSALNATNVGSDLSIVFYKFMHWLLVDKEDGVIKFAREDGVKAIQSVGDLFKQKIKGEEVTEEEWKAAYTVAYARAAYGSRADTAVRVAAHSAAAAAYAAAEAAHDAAYAYAAHAAAYVAGAATYAAGAEWEQAYQNARVKQADKLIALIMECKTI